MSAARPPRGLGAGGRALWRGISDVHDLDASQQVQLLEACRAKDRLDGLDLLLRGDVDVWARLVDVGGDVQLRVDSALQQANATANLLKQLLAALRLPDVDSGRRPQRRGGARGAYRSAAGGGASVSPLDRLMRSG